MPDVTKSSVDDASRASPTLRPAGRALAAIAVAALAVGCDRGASSDRADPRILAGPKLTANPNAMAPLAAIVEVETDEPTRIEVEVDDGETTRRVTIARELSTEHRAPLLGLRADTSHRIAVTAIDAAGNRGPASARLNFKTPPLPEGFPPIQVAVRDVERMEPGVTLFNARGSGPPAVPPSNAFLIMVDDLGRVVWYFESTKDVVSASRLRNGNLLYLSGRRTAVEIDMLGNVVQTWFAARGPMDEAPPNATLLDLETIHHDLFELPEGFGADFVALSTELHCLDDYPADEQLQQRPGKSANVVGDVIVEFDRDGTIVRRMRLFELLDPRRVAYDSLENFWNHTYGDVDTDDWAHANAVTIDPLDLDYVVSTRNQDAVFKVDRESGTVRWILAPPLGWREPWSDLLLRPVGAPFEWSQHQHAPRFSQSGDLILFDNGNGRATPPLCELADPLRYSRAVIYRIDEQARTVEQRFAYGGSSTPWYSFFLGGVEELRGTGNLLVTDGGKQVTPTVRQGFARVFEITREANPRIVFELIVRDRSPFDAFSWNVYRSQRLPDVYSRP